MSNKLPSRNLAFIISGLGVALLIAVFVSPFASSDPDGLDRVSQDLKFEHKASEDAPAQKLPFANIFDEYALKGVPEAVATPMAGLVGTLATFGLAYGIGKLAIKKSSSSIDHNISSHQEE
ncbi:cobalt transport protein [Pleurocapsa sp. CCALA 161]|uniref:PDGLE domain-containing protein n=1 Tax=Pleurocapsa sp. CCALA 161 TaxID=2107688 RepID=UPI000D0850DE|nr:PDGLE domain-containing protein [Pleurocapsa sp. CCALA 161]PSB12164.1 cobalt transport protein [Pleurocapsa sp. CCALA 161]